MKLFAFLFSSAFSTLCFAQVSGFPALEDYQTITYQRNSRQGCIRTTTDASGKIVHVAPSQDHDFGVGVFGKHCDENKKEKSKTYTVLYDFTSSEYMCRSITPAPTGGISSAYESEWLCGIDL